MQEYVLNLHIIPVLLGSASSQPAGVHELVPLGLELDVASRVVDHVPGSVIL
jgi:hypothetical protein